MEQQLEYMRRDEEEGHDFQDHNWHNKKGIVFKKHL